MIIIFVIIFVANTVVILVVINIVVIVIVVGIENDAPVVMSFLLVDSLAGFAGFV